MMLTRGKFIIEVGGGGDLLVMYPDGSVRVAGTAKDAQALVNKWSGAAAKKTGGAVAVVEWRGVTPPEEEPA
jgi:hypothetical protein